MSSPPTSSSRHEHRDDGGESDERLSASSATGGESTAGGAASEEEQHEELPRRVRARGEDVVFVDAGAQTTTQTALAPAIVSRCCQTEHDGEKPSSSKRDVDDADEEFRSEYLRSLRLELCRLLGLDARAVLGDAVAVSDERSLNDNDPEVELLNAAIDAVQRQQQLLEEEEAEKQAEEIVKKEDAHSDDVVMADEKDEKQGGGEDQGDVVVDDEDDTPRHKETRSPGKKKKSKKKNKKKKTGGGSNGSDDTLDWIEEQDAAELFAMLRCAEQREARVVREKEEAEKQKRAANEAMRELRKEVKLMDEQCAAMERAHEMEELRLKGSAELNEKAILFALQVLQSIQRVVAETKPFWRRLLPAADQQVRLEADCHNWAFPLRRISEDERVPPEHRLELQGMHEALSSRAELLKPLRPCLAQAAVILEAVLGMCSASERLSESGPLGLLAELCESTGSTGCFSIFRHAVDSSLTKTVVENAHNAEQLAGKIAARYVLEEKAEADGLVHSLHVRVSRRGGGFEEVQLPFHFGPNKKAIGNLLLIRTICARTLRKKAPSSSSSSSCPPPPVCRLQKKSRAGGGEEKNDETDKSQPCEK